VGYVKLGGTFTGAIKPRNPQQACLFDMLKDKTSKIKLVTGRFGSGKTLAMTNAALELIEKGKFDRIVWVRNNVAVKDAPDIGFLPGTELEKLKPFLGPLIDHAGGEEGVGKLLDDAELYYNLTQASNNLSALLADLQANPHRYINISVFGDNPMKKVEKAKAKAEKKAIKRADELAEKQHEQQMKELEQAE
jgi:hypothetical protein